MREVMKRADTYNNLVSQSPKTEAGEDQQERS